MSNMKPDIKSIIDKLSGDAAMLRRYSFVAFIILVSLLYGFVLFRINSLTNAQPSSSDVEAQTQASAQVPHIDQAVVQHLKSLQDNSVSVQTLFDQARSNPFQ